MFGLDQFTTTPNKVWLQAREERWLTHNPPDQELRSLVEKEPEVRKTIHGNYVGQSEPTPRSAMFTKNSIDDDFGEHEPRLLKQCDQAPRQERLVSVDRIVGDENSNTTVRLIFPERFAHVAYGASSLFWLPGKRSRNRTITSCSSLTSLLTAITQDRFPTKTSPSDYPC